MIQFGDTWAAFSLLGARDRQCDAFRVHTHWGPEEGTLVFVADGHGPDGKKSARLVDQKLAKLLLDAGFAPGKEESAVREACLSLDRRIKHKYDGGTTLTLAYLSRRYSFLAWVGDSPAFCYGRHDVRLLTRSHVLGRCDELERLQAVGAKVHYRKKRPVRVCAEDGSNRMIELTRSIGDRAYDPPRRIASGKELLPPLPEFMCDQEVLARAEWIMLTSDGVPRALDESLIPSSELEFLQRERGLTPQQAAERFHKLVLRAHPDDNSTVALARPYHSL